MKRILKKIVFITLFFSAVISSMKANDFALISLAISSTMRKANFLKEQSAFKRFVFIAAVTAASSAVYRFIWKIIKKEEILNKDFLSAIKKEDLSKVSQLLARGANINVQKVIVGQIVGNTALMDAVDKGNLEMAQLLLEKGADVNIQNFLGNTALMRAVNKGNLKMAQLLLEKGADVDLQQQEKIKFSFKNDVDRNVLEDRLGRTALMSAVDKGNLEMVQLLLEKGANIDLQGRSGLTALMMAVSKGHLEMAQLLLKKGANVDLQDMLNETALGKAIKKGYLEIAQLLLEKEC